MNEKEQAKANIQSKSVNIILDTFKNNVFGIEYYFNKFVNIAQDTDIEELKQLTKYLMNCFEEIGIDIKRSKEEQRKVKISSDKVLAFANKMSKQPKTSTKNYEILSRSSFLMLNSYFEYLLSDLLAYYYNKFQKSLYEKRFNFALKEINEFDSIEEFTKSLITKEVESMMVELSFDELLKHFESSLGIEKEDKIVNWDIILECRERRHLIVHNSSLVNKKYIVRTNNPYNFKTGDTVHIDEDYFKNVCKEFFLAGILISYNCWGKWDKELSSAAIKEILNESFELLKKNELQLVSRLTDYLIKIEPRTPEDEDYLMRAKFNRFISLKKLEDPRLSKELKKIKVGTASPIFKLAYAILADEHKEIVDLIKQAKALKEIDIEMYREWPLFDFLRTIPEINVNIEKELDTANTKAAQKRKQKNESQPQKTITPKPLPIPKII